MIIFIDISRYYLFLFLHAFPMCAPLTVSECCVHCYCYALSVYSVDWSLLHVLAASVSVGVEYAGAVYVYRPVGAVAGPWTLSQILTGTNMEDQFYGWSISFYQGQGIVGAPGQSSTFHYFLISYRFQCIGKNQH